MLCKSSKIIIKKMIHIYRLLLQPTFNYQVRLLAKQLYKNVVPYEL